MSGRYALLRWNPSPVALPGFPADWRAHWSISLVNQVLMIRENAGAHRAGLARWESTPAWLIDLSCTPNHVWVETLAEQLMFREAFQQYCCLLPASGFYEWCGMRKRPYWVSTGEHLLFFVDIWEAYPVQGQTQLSMAQISQAAAEFRRPLLLDEAEQDVWPAPNTPPPVLTNLLIRPQPNLRSVALASFVNKPETDGSECLTPAWRQALN